MKLIGVTMVSNEADMIEAFVRHNLRVLDALVVLDHGSLDRTPEILRALSQEGLPLALLRDNERAFRQSERQTWTAKRFIPELQADFCFALDADELICCDSREGLRETLAGLDARACAVLTLRNYFGGEAASTEINPVRRLTRRMRVERAQSHKVVVRREFAADAEAQISFGNHAAIRVAEGRVEPYPHQLLPGVHLAHFPVRSPQQVAKKALLGWLGFRLTQPDRYVWDSKATPSGHWRRLFEHLAAGGAADAGLVRQAIAEYAGGEGREPVGDDELVEDPVPFPEELRYTVPATDTAVALMARWADQLVTDVNAGAFARRP